MKVQIAEDEPPIDCYCTGQQAGLGHAVPVAADGVEAWSLLDLHQPDSPEQGRRELVEPEHAARQEAKRAVASSNVAPSNCRTEHTDLAPMPHEVAAEMRMLGTRTLEVHDEALVLLAQVQLRRWWQQSL